MDELEYRKYTVRSEIDKAINSFKGILVGVSLDGEINDNEVNEIVEWSKKHSQLIEKYPFKEFMSIIQSVMKNELDKKNAVEDLFWLCQKYENQDFYYKALTSDLQTLQGVCHGILSDGELNDTEILELGNWLEKHTHLTSLYPYDEINSLVLSILSDGVITEEERKRLKAYLNEYVIINNKEIASDIHLDTKDVQIAGICTSDPNISFEGKTFSFTGLSKRAKRAEISKIIIDLGGQFNDNVTLKTDFLIVGETENPCWVFACYGRKVEQAIQLRKKGQNVSIVHEFDFWDYVEDLKIK